MKRIIIDYPDDCDEREAILHISGCFNPTQFDYKSLKEGYHYGTALTFGDDRHGFFYRTLQGNYVLKLEEMELPK